MESGRFTGFFRNAPFDKPGVLRVFWGYRPRFFMTPIQSGERGDLEIISGVERQEPVREGRALMDGMPDQTGLGRNFFLVMKFLRSAHYGIDK